ncbi:hypothetical protein CcI49_20840 [Frankia sp. CcI49]|nr:hypothetical protein ACG83_27110 [Frankia sp. R43]ONH58661.1 hypothetical protein CcI49_20840 [Frankia sp. CcI49]
MRPRNGAGHGGEIPGLLALRPQSLPVAGKTLQPELDTGHRQYPGSDPQDEQPPDVKGQRLPHDHQFRLARALQDDVRSENARQKYQDYADGDHRNLHIPAVYGK